MLYNAVKKNDIELVKFILDNVKNVDVSERYIGTSPVEVARIYQSDIYILKLLFDHGAKAESVEEIATYKEMNFIYNNAMSQSCDLKSKVSDPIKSIIDKSYSNSITKGNLYVQLSEVMKDNTLNKILTYIGLKDNFSLRLIENIDFFKDDSTSKGSFSPNAKGHKILIAENKIDLLNKYALIHEFTHMIAHEIFKNDSLPFNNDYLKAKFVKSVSNLHKNMYNYLYSTDYDLNIFAKLLSPYDFAKNLSKTILKKIGKCPVDIDSYNYDSNQEAYKSNCIVKSLTSIAEVYRFYTKDKEYVELFVKYTEILANDCYHNNPVMQKILEPMKEFYESEVEPLMDAEIAKLDTSQMCASPVIESTFDFQ